MTKTFTTVQLTTAKARKLIAPFRAFAEDLTLDQVVI